MMMGHSWWCHVALVVLFSPCMNALECSGGETGAVTFNHDDATNSFTLENGYVCISVDPGKVVVLSADHTGLGAYGVNTLASDGITLDRENEDGSITSSSQLAPSDVTVNVTSVIPLAVHVTMAGVRDSAEAPTVSESWTFGLEGGAQAFSFRRVGGIFGADPSSSSDVSVVAIRRQFSMKPSAVFAFYESESSPENKTSSGSVVQMKAAPSGANFFPSSSRLSRLYALGGSGDEAGQVGNASLDLSFESSSSSPSSSSSANLTVLLSSSSGDPYWSGLQEVLFGSGASNDDVWMDHWGVGWAGVPPTPLPPDTPMIHNGNTSNVISWDDVVKVGVNDRDFPILSATTTSSANQNNGNVPSDDLHALLMGTYASPVGCLCTHLNAVSDGVAVGQMATTIARPDRGYEGTYNYFDPDNYIATSALLWSGDRFLQEQVRMVVERSGSYLTDEGQLPHHFEGLEPTYQALSGEIQTGPNVFWILSCLNYAKASGNYDWLRSYMPTLRKASSFLFDLIDHDLPAPPQTAPAAAAVVAISSASASTAGYRDVASSDDVSLAKVPGSLMIDVFLRANYTSDTNAMLVGFFREFSKAESFVGNTTGAQDLSGLADGISRAMNLFLWCSSDDREGVSVGVGSDDDDDGVAPGGPLCDTALMQQQQEQQQLASGAGQSTTSTTTATGSKKVAPGAITSGDHFVTQWNQGEDDDDDDDNAFLGNGWTYRDFMDYDANLMSVAHAIPTDDPSGLGNDGGARARRVLARVDGGGPCRPSSTFVSERYYGPDDTTDGNIGDSWCAMGRIAWFDSLARKVVGDEDGFNALLLTPLQTKLLSTTWMHERLSCDGTQQLNRTNMYFEYPSIVSMLLSHVKYGIDLGYGGAVTVMPFGLDSSSSSYPSLLSSSSLSSSSVSKSSEHRRLQGLGGKGDEVSFSYHVNGVHVDFSSTKIVLDIDRSNGDDDDDDELQDVAPILLSPVAPSTAFNVSVLGKAATPSLFQATSDEDGLLSFSVPVVTGRVVVVATAA